MCWPKDGISPPAPLAAKETSADDFAEFIDVSQRGDLDEDFSGIPSWSGMSVATCHGMFTTALVSSLQVPNLALDGGEGAAGAAPRTFSLEATSPFYAGTCPPTEQLPECWRPTPSQMLVAHHPFIDFLPWPGVRERMLAVMSLPPEARPPNASSPLALVEFAYDVEDSREGMRIWGDDVYDPGSWEVGQVEEAERRRPSAHAGDEPDEVTYFRQMPSARAEWRPSKATARCDPAAVSRRA
ncbi:unnamed protein product [Parascedosporium putredinis]|uniref:Uncharacterized protein n=1 Tax=Parascedosporium putredinis TaxID=1442378 RepID=A0A9P1GUL9_9PEZI|nr:unnamed protein product [Parascedosporium putredinis]CAI7987692.1 unnamed protein product [Parascedosporium putredinis]